MTGSSLVRRRSGRIRVGVVEGIECTVWCDVELEAISDANDLDGHG
jgi:hypothetical protein